MGGCVAWFAGPPPLAVYGLARAQDIPERPRIRIGPVTKGPTFDLRLLSYRGPEPYRVTSFTAPHDRQRMKTPPYGPLLGAAEEQDRTVAALHGDVPASDSASSGWRS